MVGGEGVGGGRGLVGDWGESGEDVDGGGGAFEGGVVPGEGDGVAANAIVGWAAGYEGGGEEVDAAGWVLLVYG